jgi:enoyl-CoA hydratase/carnithine racemase
MVLQGHRFKAEEALNRGLVDSICPGDQVLDKALELAVKYGDKMVAGGDIYSPMRADYFKQVVCQMERESVKPKA